METKHNSDHQDHTNINISRKGKRLQKYEIYAHGRNRTGNLVITSDALWLKLVFVGCESEGV